MPYASYALLEAILFHYGDPISVKKLSSLLGMIEEECQTLLTAWSDLLRDESRGLALIREGDTVQLATKPELAPALEKIIETEFREELSNAALETLALVAYLGPVTKAMVDYIRGVNSGFTIRNLLMRGLIVRREAERSNAYAYAASVDFLKHVGLEEQERLPHFETYRQTLQTFLAGQNKETEGSVRDASMRVDPNTAAA